MLLSKIALLTLLEADKRLNHVLRLFIASLFTHAKETGVKHLVVGGGVC